MNYSVDRFLSNLPPKINKALKKVWSDGEQLSASAIPREALPNVVILAAFGNRIDVEIVDDYEDLLTRYREEIGKGDLHHPDLFFASSVAKLAERGEVPTIGSFEQIAIPTLFAELFGEQEDV